MAVASIAPEADVHNPGETHIKGALLPASPVPLRTQLLAPVIGAVLLLAVFAGVVLSLMWMFQREQMQATHAEAVRTLAVLLAREIETTTSHLSHMATSPLITVQTMDAFAERCREILKFRSDWVNIALLEPSGRQVINTLFPRGSALPTNAMQEHHLSAFRTGTPQVSRLFLGAATKKWTLAVSVPVVKGNEVVYVLSVALRSADYDSLLQQRVERAGGIGALFDASHRYAARSVAPDTVRGKSAEDGLLRAMQRTPQGSGRFDVQQGMMLINWEPVAKTGWTVAVGIPAGGMGGAVGRYLAILALAAFLILGATVIVALRLSKRLSGAMAAAGDRAFQVAQGRPGVMPRTNIVEFDRLSEALQQSAAVIAEAQRERQRLLDEEREARAAAERANKAKDELLAMLGHELRNPLAAITTSVHLLNRPERSPDNLEFAHRVITRQSLHLSRLVDDLLDVGRVITGKMRLQRMPMDLGDAAVSVVESLKATGDATGRSIVIDHSSVFINGDYTRMHQVVMNLLTNALKFTEEGGAILISVRREGADAVLCVKDDGVGMKAEDVERVFDVFYQGQDAQSNGKGGLGLGLLLVRRIVEQHGGTVTAESAGKGSGSAFTVRLPAIDTQPVASVGIAAARPENVCSVLLIEDNEDMRRVLRRTLEDEGHQVHEAEDGLSGLTAAVTLRPDVAIVDIGLPGMSGLRVAEAIRSQTGRDIFLIALTGHGQPDDVRKSTQAGFDTHMVKPPDIPRLTRILAGLADRHTPGRGNRASGR